jgi:hypothetical protein
MDLFQAKRPTTNYPPICGRWQGRICCAHIDAFPHRLSDPDSHFHLASLGVFCHGFDAGGVCFGAARYYKLSLICTFLRFYFSLSLFSSRSSVGLLWTRLQLWPQSIPRNRYPKTTTRALPLMTRTSSRRSSRARCLTMLTILMPASRMRSEQLLFVTSFSSFYAFSANTWA